MNKREFLKLMGQSMILVGLPWTKSSAEMGPKGPSGGPLNLLFVTVDDMNGDSPGWMGNPLRLTPNLDAFAATANRMVNNHAAAPICQPSREAMMTGLVPHRSGGLGFDPVHEGTPTLTTLLQAAGYFAVAINKEEHMQPESCFPWDLKFKKSGKNPEVIGEQLSEAIRAAQSAKKPFFINCNITDPHRPFFPGSRKEDGEVGSLDWPLEANEVKVPSFLEDLPPIREEVAKYYSSVKRLDLSFGSIIHALEASGEADRTVVLFVADHGMSFPFAKATVYANGTWTPAVLRVPGMDKSRTFEELTCSTDIMPTLLDALHIAKPQGLDGRSWLPLFAGEKQPDRDFVISNVNSVSSGKQFPQRCVQTLKRALIFSPWSDGNTKFHVEAMSGHSFKAMDEAAKGNPKLKSRVDQYIFGYPMAFYDLEKDPDQRVNLIADPNYKSEVAAIQKTLLAYMERTGDPQLDNLKAALSRCC
ncbi:sulfatase [soil metagenome]